MADMGDQSQQRQLQHVQLALFKAFPGIQVEPERTRDKDGALMQFTVTFRGKTDTFLHPFPVDSFRSEDWAVDNAIEWVVKRFPPEETTASERPVPMVPLNAQTQNGQNVRALLSSWLEATKTRHVPMPPELAKHFGIEPVSNSDVEAFLKEPLPASQLLSLGEKIKEPKKKKASLKAVVRCLRDWSESLKPHIGEVAWVQMDWAVDKLAEGLGPAPSVDQPRPDDQASIQTAEDLAVWLCSFYGPPKTFFKDLEAADQAKWLDDARRVTKLVRGG